MSKCDKVTSKFEEPLNKVLEVLISVIVGVFGVIAFVKIMTPSENSLLYQVDDFLRFGFFVTSIFLIMSFVANPLFNMLKVDN